MFLDGSINPGEMKSFNHYALGAVADWMHINISGLSMLEPRWRKFCIALILGGDLTSISTRYLNPYGMISVKWATTGSDLR